MCSEAESVWGPVPEPLTLHSTPVTNPPYFHLQKAPQGIYVCTFSEQKPEASSPLSPHDNHLRQRSINLPVTNYNVRSVSMQACYRNPDGQLTVFSKIHFHPLHILTLYEIYFEAYIVVYNTEKSILNGIVLLFYKLSCNGRVYKIKPNFDVNGVLGFSFYYSKFNTVLNWFASSLLSLTNYSWWGIIWHNGRYPSVNTFF